MDKMSCAENLTSFTGNIMTFFFQEESAVLTNLGGQNFKILWRIRPNHGGSPYAYYKTRNTKTRNRRPEHLRTVTEKRNTPEHQQNTPEYQWNTNVTPAEEQL